MALREEGSRAGQPDGSRQRERAERILDVAAELILRWGYDKTTIDDIARQAGVAKGTIYLHWKTREDLFAALVRREKLDMGEEVKRRVAEDPAGATLRGVLKCAALTLLKRPLMKAILLRDLGVLGKLARGERDLAAYAERLDGFKTYLAFLRDSGLVRGDLSLPAHAYAASAIFMGFLLVAPLLPDEFRLSNEQLAELLAETVHRTLEPDRSISSEEHQAASRAFLEYVERAMSPSRRRTHDSKYDATLHLESSR